MVVRPQRWVFPRRSRPPLLAADHGLGLRVRGGQCRGAEPLSVLLVELDQAADRGTPLAARLWPRHLAFSLPGQSQGDRLSARIWRRNRSVRRQSLTLSASRGARPFRLARPSACRAVGAKRLSPDRRTALPPHPARIQLFLVRADDDTCRGGELAHNAPGVSYLGHAA